MSERNAKAVQVSPAAATVGARRPGARAGVADRVEAVCLFALAAAMVVLIVSGNYTRYTTPRTLPYLVLAIVLLAVLGVVAWRGVFHMSVRDMRRMFVALCVPAVILLVPFQTERSTFDRFAGNRAVAISAAAAGEGKGLHGLDEAKRTITIGDDEFGSWYEHIDQHPQQYEGYTVTVTGFSSTSSTFSDRQFRLSRMLMTCCVLDMTPFGFTTQYADGAASTVKDHTWVTVRGRLQIGEVGVPGHSSTGMVLHIESVAPADHTPSGYFYRE